MNTNFLDFIKNKKQFIKESFNTKESEKAFDAIDKVLSKHINGLVPLVGYVKTKQGSEEFYSKQYMVIGKDPSDVSLFQFNFSQDDTKTDIYSIDFFKDTKLLFDGNSKSDLTIYTLGSSIVYFLPIVWNVVKTKNYKITKSDAVKLLKTGTNESYEYTIGSLRYIIHENLSNDIIRKTYNNVTTSNIFESELDDLRTKKYAELRAARAEKNRNKTPENINRWKKIVSDIQEIDNAIRGGSTTIKDLQMTCRHNVSLSSDIGGNADEMEEELTSAKEDPDAVFKKMTQYVKMVIKGINPSVILCGAPGVGKTYNVKQLLKANGYHEGHNMITLKGKCTPRVLYTTLLDYKNKGNITLIDDADGLVGPGAPEDSINILKAALDSSTDDEGRLVTYGIAGKLTDDEGVQLPKRFYYNGGVIVITNYQAGSLDTALRGRSFIQDIHFSVEDILKRIQTLLPRIDVEHLSAKSKIKAYNYLVELAESKADMEISIRTFIICAKIFETASGDNDFSDEEAKLMIKEQMKLQSLRSSRKKY